MPNPFRVNVYPFFHLMDRMVENFRAVITHKKSSFIVSVSILEALLKQLVRKERGDKVFASTEKVQMFRT